MTLTEAAASLGISADTLRQAIHRGTLKAKPMYAGRLKVWTVTPSEVERYRRDSLGHKGRRAK